jgi:protein gp37
VFDNQVPESWRADLFSLIRGCVELDWLLLTKRPQNIRKMLPRDWGEGYPNVWIGMTAENQKHYDQRWQALQKIPARVRFVSYEPAIGPVRLPSLGPHPDWLISGGESGGGARHLNPQWVRDIINDCRRVGIAPFHKQWGTYRNNPLVAEQGMTVADAQRIDEFGKGGRLLDGELIREFPTSSFSVGRRAA